MWTVMDSSHANGTSSANYTIASDSGFDFKLYRYDPSLPAAVIAVAVFASLTTLHFWKIFRHGSLYFIAFAVGGVFQTVGYCGRIWSHFAPTALGGFITQAILILVAPALYAASIYMILGRLIRALRAESLSVIPVRFLTKIFVTGDVASFLLQGGGGGIQAGGSLDLFNIGEKIIIVGLFMQIAFFSFFLMTAVTFHRRMLGWPSNPTSAGTDTRAGIAWRRHLYVLYTVSAVILVRSVFRVVEYLQGNDGFLISHEVFLYIFDTLLMVLVMTLFLVFYIDDLNVHQGKGDLEMKGRRAGEGYATQSSDDGLLSVETGGGVM